MESWLISPTMRFLALTMDQLTLTVAALPYHLAEMLAPRDACEWLRSLAGGTYYFSWLAWPGRW